ncbi:hypothetical protein H257_16713 [Aphanomyces astaci]|uniref:VTT domain-containing protein n=1 Tax=Aphanomyces astaci TaxID=112090 RepID=W4FJI1_APHAT|nr:hypothetical protein H257_16713 [Aphanomyces astaci]ETV66903.1 hypothetical protein H257_16713 [Aphanomyces astaci]|eukprot:XP_009843546.1 hypothetical protein H257_16713 [Aphanomyces astaci]
MMKKVAVVAVTVVVTASLGMWRLSSTGDLKHVMHWVQNHPVVGGGAYVVVFAMAVVACLPASVFELAAGYIFGFGWGWVIAASGKTLGSVISFALGRYYLQGWVHKMLRRGPPLFRALAQLTSRNELKWKIVILTRIAWMPIGIKNYGLSILPVSFALFFWPMLLVGSIFSAISAYLGHTATHVKSILTGDGEVEGGGGTPTSVLHVSMMVVGAGSAFTLIGILGYHTRRHLEEMTKDEGSDGGDVDAAEDQPLKPAAPSPPISPETEDRTSDTLV